MTEPNERVKFVVSIIDPNISYKCVCSYECAKRVMLDIQNVSLEWVSWCGVINDLDANESEFLVRRADIVSADIMKGNQF
jgi:hypothetical protein